MYPSELIWEMQHRLSKLEDTWPAFSLYSRFSALEKTPQWWHTKFRQHLRSSQVSSTD